MRSHSFIFAFCLVALVCRTEPGIRILGVFLRDAACTSTGFCWTELGSDWQNRRYIYREKWLTPFQLKRMDRRDGGHRVRNMWRYLDHSRFG